MTLKMIRYDDNQLEQMQHKAEKSWRYDDSFLYMNKIQTELLLRLLESK